MAKAVSEGEDLAQVVVASDVRQTTRKPWYVVLRPWLYCLFFLLLVEFAARYYFDRGDSLHGERFDNFPNAALEDRFVDQIRHDDAFRVVVIGDSVVVGPSLLERNQTIPSYMEAALNRANPGRKIHVWNMAFAGARATDEYCMLLKVLDAKPDLVVVEANYFITILDIKQLPLWNSALARNLPEVPPEIVPYLDNRKPQQVVEDTLTDLFEKNIRVLGMRQAINAELFGVQPRVPFSQPNPAVMTAVTASKRLGYLTMERWDKRGYTLDQFASSYGNPLTTDNLNGHFYRVLIHKLETCGIPAITYATPQNPAVRLAYVPPKRYADNRRMMATYLASPTVPYHDYDDLVPTEQFYDNDHLMAAGNRLVGEALARDAAPMVQAALARKGQ